MTEQLTVERDRRRPSASPTSWVGAHLYYQGDLDLALRHWVRPSLSRLTERGLVEDPPRWFFLRYWEGGNHLRFRVAVPTGAEDAVRQVLAVGAADLRTRYPAPDLMTDADYARLASVLAVAEDRDPGASALRPNNTLTFEPYVPEHDRYGYGPALASVEEHFVDASGLALALVSAGADRAQRLSACFACLLTAWYGSCRAADLVELVDALVDAWSRRTTQWSNGGSDGSWAQRYADQRAALRRRADDLRRGDTDPVTARWAASVEQLRDRLHPLVRSGAFRPAPRPGWERHRGPEQQTLSVLDLCAHLMCNRVGLTSVDEAYLRYAAVTVVADQLGTTGGPR